VDVHVGPLRQRLGILAGETRAFERRGAPVGDALGLGVREKLGRHLGYCFGGNPVSVVPLRGD
jgi:hypothetical protein